MNTFIKDGKLGYSESEKRKLLAEIQDPEKLTLVCGKHNYVPDLLKAPLLQCENCWQAYLYLLVGSMPPHVREEFLEALVEFSHKTVENPFGYVPFDKPEIEIVKET